MTKPRTTLRFLFGEELRELSGFDPTLTILDWLRLQERKLGTKEGCAEGDCGACTVVVGWLAKGKLVHRAINACIAPLASLDGRQLVVIEHLKRNGELHPVQQAMVQYHGSQCGFCTPGIVMSLYALWLNEDDASEARIEDALAGNLCRCTGYQPILAAARAMFALGEDAKAEWRNRKAAIAKRLVALQDERTLEISQGDRRFIAPASLPTLAKAYRQNPAATIIAGATDAGLWLTKEMRIIDTVIHPGRVAALDGIEKHNGELVIGAMTSLYDAAQALGRLHPHLSELLRRFGGEQIRNAGTVGGNIANGSPIGDLPPVLIALGATLVLRRDTKQRELPLEKFFLGYKKQDRRPFEFVEGIRVPKLAPSSRFHVSKISKRFDEDISAVCGAFRLDLDKRGRIREARLAFGGMAATPKRATATEDALLGNAWNQEAADRAAPFLERDFQPLDDWRASARYRMLCAQNLLRRFAIESSSKEIETRVAGELSQAHVERETGGPELGGRSG
jgi:xanthine dehydrogenase small subunit